MEHCLWPDPRSAWFARCNQSEMEQIPCQTKRKKLHRIKNYETLKNMRKVSIFGVYVFVLFMLAFSYLDWFRLHRTKLKSVLCGNVRLSLNMVLYGAGSSLQFPTSASKPQTHYQFVIGMKSLISSWLPSSVLIVLSTTNSVLKGKIYKRRVTEGWTARASNMPPLFLPLPLLQYMTQAGYF